MSAWRQDLSRDELNRSWDAVVGLDPGVPPTGDSEDVVLLRRFHALDTAPLPSPGFLADLERKLVTRPPAPVATRKGVRVSKIASFQNARPALQAPGSRPIPKPHRWTSMQRAAAVLSVMLVVSLLVLYQAVPGPSEPPPIPAAVIAKPALETLVQFDFAPPLLGMPDATAWTHLDLSLVELDPGKSFTTDADWYTSVDGPLVLMVLSGELTIQPAGPALFYPAGKPGRPPVEIPAGTTVSVNPNDAIVYSGVDTAVGSNPGSEPMFALLASTGYATFIPAAAPVDISRVDFNYETDMPGFPTEGASVLFQRLKLAPFDSFVFAPDANWSYIPVLDQSHMGGMYLADGAVDELSPDVDADRLYTSSQLRYLDPGPHKIFNLGEETVDIYFLVVEPAPVASTPTP